MRNRALCLFVLMVFILAACAPAATPAVATQAGQPTQAAPPAEPVTIRFAALSVLDALPVYVADQQGYFAKHGVKVELLPVTSAPERDQLIAAEQADGMINEVLSTLLSNKEQTRVQVVRYARTATADSVLFRILAAKDSGITTPEQLKGVEIAISNATVIEYLNDRLLQAEGLQPDEIATIAVPKIPDRLALLLSGEVKAGVMPDPLASLAMLQGAVNVLDDTSHPEYSFSTVSFRKAFIDQNPEAVRGFLAAWEDAVKDINANGNQFKANLVERKIIPEPLLESFQVPAFVTAGVPTEAQVADVQDWARGKGLLDQDLPYGETVNSSFLPAP